MKSIKKYAFLVLIIPVFAFSMHKYYLSFTTIKFSEKDKSLQVITRIFIDDLEKTLNENYNIESKLSTKNEIKNADEYINKYLTEKFLISINGKKKSFEFIGKEYSDNEAIIYFEFKKVKRIKTITVYNSALTETFDNQQNVIKLKIDSKKKSYILTKDDDTATLNL